MTWVFIQRFSHGQTRLNFGFSFGAALLEEGRSNVSVLPQL